jgi:hypothetical protein
MRKEERTRRKKKERGINSKRTQMKGKRRLVRYE